MKKLLFILTITFLTFSFSSCTKKGIHLSSNDVQSDNYWQNQSKKIVHRNERYSKMEKRYALKEKKSIDKIMKYTSKRKKITHSKRLAQTRTFDFH